MSQDVKLQIYQGIIKYLLSSTDYSLKRIAALSNISIKNIQLIYRYNQIPKDLKSEIHLLRLYQIVIELEMKRQRSIIGYSK